MNRPKLIIYDFDGVLTDNRVWVDSDGKEMVVCNRSDGLFISKIRELGITQYILSTEENPVVKHRAKKLNLPCVQGSKNKVISLESILKEQGGLSWNEIWYVGNDINDLECMQKVAFALAPSDSHPDILKIAHCVLGVKGGTGIVRFVLEQIYKTSSL